MQELILSYRSKIRFLIKSLTGSGNEDLEQEVYLKICANLRKNYREQGEFSAWIKKITLNVCRDYFKSNYFKLTSRQKSIQQEQEVLIHTQTPEETLTEKERQQMVLKAVDHLPSHLKKTLILYEFEGLSYEETAKQLNVPVGTIRSRLFQARHILSVQLQQLKGK